MTSDYLRGLEAQEITESSNQISLKSYWGNIQPVSELNGV
jgi:hypothetical protein